MGGVRMAQQLKPNLLQEHLFQKGFCSDIFAPELLQQLGSPLRSARDQAIPGKKGTDRSAGRAAHTDDLVPVGSRPAL